MGLVALLAAPYRWWLPILLWLTAVDTLATWFMFDVFSLPDDGIKAGLVAAFVRRGQTGHYKLDSLQAYVKLLLGCILFYPLVALASAPSLDLWTGFWLGDILGVSLVVPLVFLKKTPEKGALIAESLATSCLLLVSTVALFSIPSLAPVFAYEFPYLLLPLLLWMSTRLPDRVVAFSTIGAAAIAVYNTGHGRGPFLALPISPADQLLMLQAYLLVVTVGPIVLSLGLYERKTASGESWMYTAELKERNKIYRLLFESSGIAIALLQDRSLIQMNRRLLQLFELAAEEDILSLAPKRQADGRLSTEVAEEIYLQSAEKLVSRQWSALKNDGTELELDLSLFPLPGTNVRVLTAIDVTPSRSLLKLLQQERESLATRVEKRSEELSRANANLTVSTRSKQEFVAHLSHELKTPLTAIIAQSETLLEELYGPLTEEQFKGVKEMRDNGERLSRLIIDLLDLNRLEAGQVQLRPQQLRLSDVLQRVLVGIEPIQQRRKLDFQLTGDGAVDLTIDQHCLLRILELILGRAARQTKEGGNFGLRIETWDQLNKLDLTVWDTGSPLTAETVVNLRQPYALRSETENKTETGLGLAVATGYLELLGGDLEVRSSAEGTLITASLPLGNPS